MRCPYCASTHDRVIDSRPFDEETAIRRRRQCQACGRRFTTFERVEEAPLMVRKRHRPPEPFSLAKLVSGVEKACKNRPVSQEQIELLAADVEEALRAGGRREVSSQEVGIAVLDRLRDLDAVAYMRFASVYKDFQDPADFEREVRDLRGALRKTTPPKVGTDAGR